MIFRQRLERALFVHKAIATSIFVITSLFDLLDIFTIPGSLDKHTMPWLKTSSCSRLDKVNFTVISKTALLCWQKSSQRYISESEGILKAPFLLSYGANAPSTRHTERCFSKRTTTELYAWWCLAQKPDITPQQEVLWSLCCIWFFFIHIHFLATIIVFKTYGPTLWITQQYRIMKAATKARPFRIAVRVKMVPLQKACHTWLIHRRILMVQQGWLGKDK